MSAYLSHEANLARLDDLRRRAGNRRAAREYAALAARPAPDSRRAAHRAARIHADEPIAIRRATAADRAALERLAALDSAPTPTGEVLIAFVADEPHAAIELDSGATVADPFRHTAQLVALLGFRATRLRRAAPSRRRLRLRSRSAYRAA